MAKTVDDHIFMFFGDKAFTLKELGPAADMRFDKGFQYMIDQGMLGQHLVGREWHEVFYDAELKLESKPNSDEVLLASLYEKYEAALYHCKELERHGILTQEDKDAMLKLRRNWQAAKKLSEL